MFSRKITNIDPTQFVGGVKKKPEPNLTNWQFSNKYQCKATSKEQLPKQLSLKDKFPAPYTQTCGSCTSNAVLACDAYYYHLPTSPWIPSTVFTYYNQKVMDEDLEADDGSSVESALDCVRKLGACNSKVWPNSKPWNKKPSKKAYTNALKGKEVTKYYQIKTLLQLKKALNSGYPVAGAVAWTSYEFDSNFIMKDPTPKEAKHCDIGHAIVFVGYDDDKGLIEFRNSWGPDWANNGYAYFTYETFEKVIWYDDTYAVVK